MKKLLQTFITLMVASGSCMAATQPTDFSVTNTSSCNSNTCLVKVDLVFKEQGNEWQVKLKNINVAVLFSNCDKKSCVLLLKHPRLDQNYVLTLSNEANVSQFELNDQFVVPDY